MGHLLLPGFPPPPSLSLLCSLMSCLLQTSTKILSFSPYWDLRFPHPVDFLPFQVAFSYTQANVNISNSLFEKYTLYHCDTIGRAFYLLFRTAVMSGHSLIVGRAINDSFSCIKTI